LFGRNRRTSHWKVDFYDSVYKIYDHDANLAGYLFPNYPVLDEENQDSMALNLAKSHSVVHGGRVMLPMVKLNLLDIDEGQQLDDVIANLDYNTKKARDWKDWCDSNKDKFDIRGCRVYTAREDRQMLSILLYLGSDFALGTKEVASFLTPLLDALSENGMM
jgi:hypothetical protein